MGANRDTSTHALSNLLPEVDSQPKVYDENSSLFGHEDIFCRNKKKSGDRQSGEDDELEPGKASGKEPGMTICHSISVDTTSDADMQSSDLCDPTSSNRESYADPRKLRIAYR